MNELGQFSSAYAAITYALNFSGGVYQRPMINRMATPSAISMGLGGIDRAAQVGMIRAEMAKLGPINEAFLIASKAPRRFPCTCGKACCTKSKPNAEWRDAIAVLMNHTKNSLGLGGSYYALREAIIKRYFGEQVPLTKLAEDCRVNRDTASNHNSTITKALRSIEHHAWDLIEIRLSEIGMLETLQST
jgi:hypothetical protein